MADNYVRARLRKRDGEIRKWLDTMIAQGHEEGDLVRAGLRLLMKQEIPDNALPEQYEVSRLTPSRERPKGAPKLQVVKSNESDNNSVDDLLSKF